MVGIIENEKKRRVGFIGLGNVGKPYVENFLEMGYTVTVYDIRKDRIDLLVKKGAKPATSVKEVAENSYIVFISLPAVEAVEEVILGRNGVLDCIEKGGVIIDTSSSSSSLAEKIYEKGRERDVRVLDAPFCSDGPNRIINRTVSFYVGGDKNVLEEVRSFLVDMGGANIYYMGGPGKGQITKIINQLVLYNNRQSACEGLVLGMASGLDLSLLYEAIKNGTGDSIAWRRMARRIIKNDFEIRDGVMGYPVSVKDSSLQVELARKYDVFSPHTTLSNQLINAGKAIELSNMASFSIFLLFKKFSSIKNGNLSRNP